MPFKQQAADGTLQLQLERFHGHLLLPRSTCHSINVACHFGCTSYSSCSPVAGGEQQRRSAAASARRFLPLEVIALPITLRLTRDQLHPVYMRSTAIERLRLPCHGTRASTRAQIGELPGAVRVARRGIGGDAGPGVLAFGLSLDPPTDVWCRR